MVAATEGKLVRLVRVVAVSPGDVMDERGRLEQVVRELNRGVAGDHACQLSLWRWETDARPGLHESGPQGLIDAAMQIDKADVVIGIFWTRFGTPTSEAGSGTEHELRRAWTAWHEQGHPEVLVYFCERAHVPENDDQRTQARQLEQFRRSMPPQQLTWPYADLVDFERFVREHLTRFIVESLPAQPSPRRSHRLRPALLAVLIVLLGASYVTAFRSGVLTRSDSARSKAPQPTMTGDLNIAVAPFTTHGHATAAGTSLARATASDLKGRLARLDSSLRIQTWGPSDAAALRATDKRSDSGAAALAGRLGADLLVYGDLDEGPEATTLAPRFYLNGQKLPSAGELAGSYGYGSAMRVSYPIEINPQARATLRKGMIRRADTFATIFVGVGYYLAHALTRADAYFSRAIALGGEQPHRALLLLFLGNIANQQHRPGRATSYYQSALKLAPAYARARFGLCGSPLCRLQSGLQHEAGRRGWPVPRALGVRKRAQRAVTRRHTAPAARARGQGQLRARPGRPLSQRFRYRSALGACQARVRGSRELLRSLCPGVA